MSTEHPIKAVRRGSPAKRTAILDAARQLFLRHGVDGISMDAISTRAGVSKVTIYDYFGDKRRLFLAILSDASDSLNASTSDVLDRHLSAESAITTVSALEKALTAVAIELGTTVHSANYATVFALVAQQRMQSPSTSDDVATAYAEEALAERIAYFTRTGLLEADDPRLAASHFAALTVLLVYTDHPDPAQADPDRVRRSMTDGVHAFIRAYAAR